MLTYLMAMLPVASVATVVGLLQLYARGFVIALLGVPLLFAAAVQLAATTERGLEIRLARLVLFPAAAVVADFVLSSVARSFPVAEGLFIPSLA